VDTLSSVAEAAVSMPRVLLWRVCLRKKMLLLVLLLLLL
jgi:hypothetical protein